MTILSIAGHEYTQLDITNYEVGLEALDGEATGRSKAPGWPMIRDPQGGICNLYLEIATTSNRNPEFVRLWTLCKNMGSDDFVTASFVDPIGDVITQDVYIKLAKLKLKKFERDGKIYTDVIKLSLIAKEGDV